MWTPVDNPSLARRDKLGGEFKAFVPDLLNGKSIRIGPELSQYASAVERKIIQLAQRDDASQLENISRLLLRSEAVASSKIEGIIPKVDKVILAELSQNEEVTGFKNNAEEVARNLEVMDRVNELFGVAERVTTEDLEQLQAQLLGERSRVPIGIRELQNWIGGSDHTPIGADFVPPAPSRVQDLMTDLVEYLNGAEHGALVQAALVHAQFETIHPFADGNGRVGRALIHGVLRRRGLTKGSILPISLVLGTWSRAYVDGLGAYRSNDEVSWIEFFVRSAEEAVNQAHSIADELVSINEIWKQRLDAFRSEAGRIRSLRSDSVEAKLLKGLAAHPIATVDSVGRMYGVSRANARKALDVLSEAGILNAKSIGRGGLQGYYAEELIELVTAADRKLASSRFDTRLSPPEARGVPRL